MARYLPEATVNEIKCAYGAGESIRHIARRLNIARDTVGRYLRGGCSHDEKYAPIDDELERLIRDQNYDAIHGNYAAMAYGYPHSEEFEGGAYEREPGIHLHHPHLTEWHDPTAAEALGWDTDNIWMWETVPSDVQIPAGHGSWAKYILHGCRCDSCRASNTAMAARRRAARRVNH